MDCNVTTLNHLERMLLDEQAEPTDLPLSILKMITNDFSEDRQIGRGGFAVVYKGVLRNGGTVAVKKLSNIIDMDEYKYNREVGCLMRVRHKNIVRFLGYCADTQGKMWDYQGNFVMADVRHRLLCFEYLRKGSLHDYIMDASYGLEWKKRYQIIKGICEGLHYLHKENMVHLDLKPANILLDDKMVPKITDFGLSRCFNEEQSWAITSKLFGTTGYLAPEFYGGSISFKTDIYSLGVIITEILTGQKGYSSVDNVLENWKNRLDDISSADILLEQIRVCTEISIDCVNFDPKKRPYIQDIIQKLEETESTDEIIENDISTSLDTQISCGQKTELLIAQPLQLCFHWNPKHQTSSCSLHLTNNIDKPVAFRVLTRNPEDCFLGPLYGLVLPGSCHTLHITICKPLDDELFTLQSSIAGDEYLSDSAYHYNRFFITAEEEGREVQQMKLAAIVVQEILQEEYPLWTESIAMHPIETWVITCPTGNDINIWDYCTQKIVTSSKFLEVDSRTYVSAAIFIAQKQWFVAGDYYGCIKVYSYETMQEVKFLKAHASLVSSLDIHPIEPYLLSASRDKVIKLWNWENGWVCVRTFDTQDELYHVKFNPKDADYFASASMACVQIWNIGSSDPKSTVSWEQSRVRCFDYFTRGDQLYLIIGHCNGSTTIWDCEGLTCVKTLNGHTNIVTTACSHPNLSLLITGSLDGTVRTWNSFTFELEGVLDCGLGVQAIACLKGSRRIMIGHDDGLAMTEITTNNGEALACERP